MRNPNRFAAAVPVCGGGDVSKAKSIAHIPMWIFHGAEDNVVNTQYSLNMHHVLSKAGINSKITIYPDANHNSWDNAFAEKDFLSWMFSQYKNDN